MDRFCNRIEKIILENLFLSLASRWARIKVTRLYDFILFYCTLKSPYISFSFHILEVLKCFISHCTTFKQKSLHQSSKRILAQTEVFCTYGIAKLKCHTILALQKVIFYRSTYSILKVIIIMVYVYERLLYTLLDIGTCFWNTIKNSTCRYCLSQFVAWLHNDCQWGNILSKELWHLQKKWWPITDSSCHMTYILLTLFKPQHSYCFCHELCNSLHNENVDYTDVYFSYWNLIFNW